MKKINWFLPFTLLFGVLFGCSEVKKQPEWQKATALTERIDHPNALTVDGEFIYFVTGGTIASLNEGTSGVWKMPITGGQPIQLFKGFQKDKNSVVLPDTFFLATDKKFVYWSSGTIWRTPKDGGESEPITTASPTDFALDEEKIYWQNFIGEGGPPAPIYSVENKGGTPKAMTEPLITSGITVDKEFMFWAQSDGIYKMPKSGGEKTKIYSAPEKQNISGLIADKDNFYFTQGDGRNALFKLAKSGGEAVKIAPSINHALKFYADEANIYFVRNESSFQNSISKVAKSGGEVTMLDTGHIASFAVGKDKIFVADVIKIYALGK